MAFYRRYALYVYLIFLVMICFIQFLCVVLYSRPARVIKPRITQDAPRAAIAARKPVVPASSVQQKPARRDFAKSSGGGAVPKRHSPSVTPSGPGARHKKPVKVCVTCIVLCVT